MSFIQKVGNLLSFNAINIPRYTKEVLVAIFTELTTDNDSRKPKEKYDTLIQNFTSEQYDRLVMFTRWLQVLWGISAIGLLYSVVSLDILTIFYFGMLSCWLYIFLGYRIWILNTRLYPSFIQYLKLLITKPFAGIPYNNKHLTGLNKWQA